MSHTPEPWPPWKEVGIPWSETGKPVDSKGRYYDHTHMGPDDYERARACVNALANVPDPEAAVQMAREALRFTGYINGNPRACRMLGTHVGGCLPKHPQCSVCMARAALDALGGAC